MRDERDLAGEAVSTLGDCLEEVGAAGVVAQGIAKAVDGDVEALVIVEEFFVGPEDPAELLAGDQGVGAFEEDREQARGLLRQALAAIPARQCAGIGIKGEFPKSELRSGHRANGVLHVA